MNENTLQPIPYFTAKDIMFLLNIGRSRAYKIIRELNVELTERGVAGVIAGRVPQAYFWKRVRP